MNCMHDRNKETFWVVLRKQKSRAKAHAIMQSKSRGFPSSQTGISSRTRTNPETNTFKLQNKAADFFIPRILWRILDKTNVYKSLLHQVSRSYISLVWQHLCVWNNLATLPFAGFILSALLVCFCFTTRTCAHAFCLLYIPSNVKFVANTNLHIYILITIAFNIQPFKVNSIRINIIKI